MKEIKENEPKKPKASGLLKWQVKSRKYYIKDKYTILPETYQKWYCQQKGNSWEEFNTWIIKNYLPDVIRPVKKNKSHKNNINQH